MRIIIEPNKLPNGRQSRLDPWRARLADHTYTLAYGETKTAAKQAAEQALVSAYIGTCTTPVVRLASDRSIFVGDAISEREVRISHFYCDDDGNPIDGKCSVSFAECVCSHPALVAEVERAERSYSEAIPVNNMHETTHTRHSLAHLAALPWPLYRCTFPLGRRMSLTESVR
jgi:hypothetical protein